MANHVWTNTQFHNPNVEDFNPFDGIEGINGETAHVLLEALGIELPDEEEVETRSWYVDNIGAKWCSIEDLEGDYLTTESAWSAPITFVETLVKKLCEKYPGTYATMMYEDEAYNFVGVNIIDDGGIDDYIEYDPEELFEKFLEDNAAELAEANVNLEEVEDIGQVLFDDNCSDIFYEWLSDLQQKNQQELVECFEESFEDEE